jgi:hypothetical protein
MFEFQDGGLFFMTDASGTWTQNRSKFTVVLDPADLEFTFEDLLLQMAGFEVDVTDVTGSLTGTEQRNGKIKGSFKIALNFYVLDLDCHGEVKASGSFTGRRLADGRVALDSVEELQDPSVGPQFLKSVAEAMTLSLPSGNE